MQRVSRLCLSSGVGFQKVSTVPVFLSLMKISLSCEGKGKMCLPYKVKYNLDSESSIKAEGEGPTSKKPSNIYFEKMSMSGTLCVMQPSGFYYTSSRQQSV